MVVLDGGSGGLGLGEVGLEEHKRLRVQRLQAQVFVFEDGRLWLLCFVFACFWKEKVIFGCDDRILFV